MSKRAILVVGPPRSGTSVVSHVVNSLGADFGDPARFVDPERHTFNPIFFELQSLNDLNDEVLARFGTALGRADWLPELADFDEALIEAFIGKVAGFIESEFDDSALIGLKDTRFCFVLPLWETILGRLGFQASYVLVRRAAHATFASNQSLNHYSNETNFRLVAQATLAARHFLEGRKFEVVRYEELLRKPRTVIQQLCAGLELDATRIGSACEVIRRDLDHQASFADTPHFSYFSRVLDAPSWSPEDYLAYREIAAAARELEMQKARALEQALAQRDARIAETSQVVDALRAQTAALTGEVQRQAAQIATLTGSVAERSEEVARLIGAAAERDDQIKGLGRALADRDAEVARVNAALIERDDRIGALEQSVRQLEEQVTLAGDRETTRGARIRELEGAVDERDAQLEQYRVQRARDDRLSWRIPKPRYVLSLLTEREPTAAGVCVHGPLRAVMDWPARDRITVVSGPCFVSGWAADMDRHRAAPVRVVVQGTAYDADSRERPDVRDAVDTRLPVDTGFAARIDLPPGWHALRAEARLDGDRWIPFARARLLRLPSPLGANVWRRLRGGSSSSKRDAVSASEGAADPTVVTAAVRAKVDWPVQERVSVVSEPCFISGWAVDAARHAAANVRVVVAGRSQIVHRRERPDVRDAVDGSLPLEVGFAARFDPLPGWYPISVEVEAEDGKWVPFFHGRLLRLPAFMGKVFWRRLLRSGARARVDETQKNSPFIGGCVVAHVDWPRGRRWYAMQDPCVVSGWAADLQAAMAARVRVRIGNDIVSPDRVAREDVRGIFSPQYDLPLQTGFASRLDLRLGLHRVAVESEIAAGNWVEVRHAHVLRLPGLPLRSMWRRSREGRRPDHDGFVDGHLVVHIDKPQAGGIYVAPQPCVVTGWGVELGSGSAAKLRVVVDGKVIQPYAIAREDVQVAFASQAALPLETGFYAILALPLGLHRMSVEVQTAAGEWKLVRRTLLARVPFLKEGLQRHRGIPYGVYLRREKRRMHRELPEIRRHIEVMPLKPAFTVMIDARGHKGSLARTMRSLERQWYPPLQVRVVGDAGTEPPRSLVAEWSSELSVAEAKGDFVVVLEADELLANNALYEFASAINQHPDADLVYGDEDLLDPLGRRRSGFHKPAWSPDYLESFDYVGGIACFRHCVALRCSPATHRYDFVLRFTEHTDRIVHLARPLGCHIGRLHTSRRQVQMDVAALEARLRRTGRSGGVRPNDKHAGCYDIRLQLARTPRVSVLLPTAGKAVTVGERRIDLITNIVTQLRQQTHYPDLEIVIIDNGDLSAGQIEVLEAHGCVRTTYTEPVFNIAKKLNMGAELATGELLLILNDDIELLDPSWMERMVEHFEKPHVGVVGAKLLYPDGLTQHVGVVHNHGNPDHVRRMRPRHEAGYYFSTCGVRNYSAVTGACMMTPAAVYRAVGGYSEALAVSFNDVDYCFKVRERGLSIVYAPGAELVHMESQSRIAFADPAEVAWFHRRWAPELVTDPFYNEQFLTIARPTFEPCVNKRMV